jgi:hypothetical protein
MKLFALPVPYPTVLFSASSNSSNTSIQPNAITERPTDSFVKARSGAKYPGLYKEVDKAAKAFESSYSSESAQKLYETAEAWLAKLEISLAEVKSCPDQTAVVMRNIEKANQYLKEANQYK